MLWLATPESESQSLGLSLVSRKSMGQLCNPYPVCYWSFFIGNTHLQMLAWQ